MKKIVLAYLLFLSAAGSSRAQCPAGPAQQINAYYEYLYTKFRHLLQIPRHIPGVSCRDTADLYYNVPDSALHWLTPSTDRSFLQHANQGAYDSNYTVQLGEPLNQPGNPSRLNQAREIPLNGKTLTWWDTANNVTGGRTVWNDTAHSTLVSPYPVQSRQFAPTATDAFMWNTWYPRNYTTLYPGGKPNGAPMKACGWSWGYSENSSGGLPAPDNVYGGGYNVVNATARNDTGDAALSLRLETNFKVLGNFGAFELHWPELFRFDGTPQRVNSWYMDKQSGGTLWENNLGQHVYKQTIQHPGQVWLELNSNADDFPQITMTGTHAASIDGIVQFTDSNGHKLQLRAIDADFAVIQNSAFNTVPLYIDPNAVVYLNNRFTTAAPVANTIVGNYDDGSYPANVNSAQLAVVSQHKGFMPPVMTTVQKLAISSPAEGLMVYDSTLHQMSYYNGTTWVNF